MPTNRRTGPSSRGDRRSAGARPKYPAPEVIRTQPKAFHRRRLLLHILTITAVVLAVSLGLSVFFKVDTVTVAGAARYSPWTVSEASGIQKGDSLIFFGKAGAASRILGALPYVKSVRFSIKLPGTVSILIEEVPVAYAVQASDESWWLMTADGKVTEQLHGEADGYTKILGLRLKSPAVGQQAVAEEAAQQEPAVTTGADRMRVLLQILDQLEANEILGQAASVNVANLQDLQMWYGSRYQVKLGDSSRLDYKIAAVKASVDQMGQYETGILDASFTVTADKVRLDKFPQ